MLLLFLVLAELHYTAAMDQCQRRKVTQKRIFIDRTYWYTCLYLAAATDLHIDISLACSMRGSGSSKRDIRAQNN